MDVNFLKMLFLSMICASLLNATDIHKVIILKDIEKFTDWLEGDVDLNILNHKGETPLHVAAYYDRLEIVRILLKKGAELDIADKEGWTALLVATNKGHAKVVRMLLEWGAEINIADHLDRTPLYWAANLDRIEVIEILLEWGAKTDLADNYGNTSLHQAGYHYSKEVILRLLNGIANPNLTNNVGYTPLFLVVDKEDQTETILMLLERGANPNIVSHHNLSPLHRAAKYGHKKIFALLLANGADPDLIGNNGLTPWQSGANDEINLELKDLCDQYRSADTYEIRVRSLWPTVSYQELMTLPDPGEAMPVDLPAELWQQVIGGSLEKDDLISLFMVNKALFNSLLPVILRRAPIHIIINYLRDNEPESLPELNLPNPF